MNYKNNKRKTKKSITEFDDSRLQSNIQQIHSGFGTDDILKRRLEFIRLKFIKDNPEGPYKDPNAYDKVTSSDLRLYEEEDGKREWSKEDILKTLRRQLSGISRGEDNELNVKLVNNINGKHKIVRTKFDENGNIYISKIEDLTSNNINDIDESINNINIDIQCNINFTNKSIKCFKV